MGNHPRSRKRVFAPRRAPDGSAFQKCDECGVSVAVALMEMHDCNMKKGVKRLKRNNEKKKNVVYCEENIVFCEEPRSPFVFFMESYAKTCKARDMVEINREAFQKWKNMSKQEQWPYVHQAWVVETSYLKTIHQEINQLSQENDDEADSAIVGKFDQDYEDYENSDSSHCWDTCDWELSALL